GLGPLIANFHARFVFGLDDEELSMALVGTPAALTLSGPTRLLARLGDRPAIEVSGARLDDGARQELLEALDGFGRTPADAGPPPTAAPAPSAPTEPDPAAEPAGSVGNPTPAAEQAPNSATQRSRTAEVAEAETNGTIGSQLDADKAPDSGHRNGTSSSGELVVQVESPSVSADDQPPPAVALLAARAQ